MLDKQAPTTRQKVSIIVLVGRPNVGKSTLFNRLVGVRRAIVGDEPGITRDRLYGEASWRGRTFRVIDTGGIIPDEKDLLPSEVFRQAQLALAEADAIVMVVDARSEQAAPDIDLARLLLRSGRPVFLAINKVDSEKQESLAEDFRNLGISRLFPISAEHGRGVAELLDALVETLPETGTEPEPENAPAEVKVAIIGHPNVGKSTLLNRLTNSSRAIVSPLPGTTRDAVDEIVARAGRRIRFIDTAGIRRKGKTRLMAEKLAVVMARKHLESADIALLVLDATEGVSALDAAIAGYAHESGRSVVIVVNKWDLVTSGQARAIGEAKGRRVEESRRGSDQSRYAQQLRQALKFLSYAPVVFISAARGEGVHKLFRVIDQVAAERRKRIGTGEINRFLETIDFERASAPFSRRVKIYYLTQAAVSPPTFIVFTDRPGKLHFSYQRFLENQIRRAFGFIGTPIWIKNRARQ
ncbi:MAG: ribosome biogenesis GTPase Der [Acidobacteria bacterium]|nr:ribosome biogenesis GTPase Der [Acidobacteriota bacterium]